MTERSEREQFELIIREFVEPLNNQYPRLMTTAQCTEDPSLVQ